MLTGSCHCGAIQIQVERRPRRLTSCNCSICRRQGGLWGYYEPSKVKITARKEDIDRYVWGDKCLRLCRCATCGCVTTGSQPPGAGTVWASIFATLIP